MMFVTFMNDTSFAQNYSWQWAQSAKGTGSENGNSVCSDASGNVLVAGYFYSDTLIFSSDTLINRGNYDVFVAKYDSLGNLLWTTSAGGIFDDVATSVTTDASGNVFVTGYFYSPVFVIENDTLINAGAGDIFILKFNTNGNLLWKMRFGGNADEAANAIGCDIEGDILLTGYFQTPVFGLGSDTINNSGNEDVFVAKLNNAGTVIWARGLRGAFNDRGNSLTTDANANIFVTGNFYSSPFFSDTDSLISSGSSDVFIAKFDSAGNTLWMKNSGGAFNDSGDGVSTDSFGNIILVSTSNSSIFSAGAFSIANTGGFDVFILKYDNDGNEIWADVKGGIFDEKAYVVRCDASGNIFITGHFHSPNIILGADTFNNQGIGDIFLVVYSASGNILWAEQLGGSADDGSSGLALDVYGNIFLSGYYISPTISCGSITLNNSGSEDIVLAKLKKNVLSVGQNEISKKPSISVYPNPSQGKFIVVSDESAIVALEVFDQSGVALIATNNVLTNSIYMDLTNRASGFYFIKIITVSGVFIKKILVQNP